jgi:hypothetical protein
MITGICGSVVEVGETVAEIRGSTNDFRSGLRCC